MIDRRHFRSEFPSGEAVRTFEPDTSEEAPEDLWFKLYTSKENQLPQNFGVLCLKHIFPYYVLLVCVRGNFSTVSFLTNHTSNLQIANF
jgi:hypothetical protein